MEKNKIKAWVQGSRPFSLPGSAIPVILGAVLALGTDKFHFGYFILTVIAIVMLQAGVNLLSDHDDFENKVDTEDSFGSSGVIFQGLLSSKELYIGGMVLLTIGCLIGLFLTYKRGWFILILEFIGAMGGYSYTGRPLRLKYRGLGAPLVFLLFGPLMVIGSYYVQTQSVSITAILVSIPLGLLTTAILHANDIRDMDQDKKAGIKTLSIIVGVNNAERIYGLLIIISYVLLLALVVNKIIPIWSLICLLTLPTAYKNLGRLGTFSDIIELDKETAKLGTQFGMMFILSMLIAFI
ncbi:MAG: 1,4-dihydroxy-2-naphthoate octaprenyltransferase [Solirubrobacterales bacterium]